VGWRATTRRLFPYLVVATGGFLAAYLIVFFVVFPGTVVPDDAQVPSVVGLLSDDATRRLRAAGFEAATGEEVYHASAPPGTVLRQSPLPGGVEARGTRVTLDVSAGQRRAVVPDLVGMTQAEAEVALQNAGFELGETVERQSDAPRGTVIATAPAAAATLTTPAAVSLVVSGGPVTVQLPEVVGQSAEDARATLEQLGLAVGIQVDEESTLPRNTVVAQSPAAGRAVPTGSSVALRISGRVP